MVNNVVDEDFRGHVRHSTEPRSSWRDMLPMFLIQIADRVKWRAPLQTTDADDTLQSRLTLFSALDGASGPSPILPRCCSVPALPAGYTSAEKTADFWSQEKPGTARNGDSSRAFHFLMFLSARVILALSILEQVVDAHRQMNVLRPIEAHHQNLATTTG
ncbi:hypothetical protein B0H65DRAFT_512609 [Neurospora tetraspora]|uniref:Uncharacterized protein n=1 Tax=Neurospora tetraspora TaxID=94610 RepID=A0AAE0MKE9_9PEZI|nr:hypothetical protein B0H65DRAFT_512609 [Neurospora tetraspora]